MPAPGGPWQSAPPPSTGATAPAAAWYPQPSGIPVAGAPLPWAPAAPPEAQWTSPSELRDGAAVVVALAVVGVLAGVVWKFWTVKTHGYDIGSNIIIPDETEGWIGGDAHFGIITGLIGLIAGPLAWRLRRSRGATMAVALAVGGVLGSLIAAGVGHLIGGGNHTVEKNTNFVDRLPLSVHTHGLLVVQAVLALATYLVATLFTARDDLGVPASAVVAGSGVPEHRPEGLRRDGDGVGSGEQRDLPPQ